MNIGIIGAGHIGGVLTRRFCALGHAVVVANSRGPETLAALARETGAQAATVAQAAAFGEVVVVTIPLKNVPRLPPDLWAGRPAEMPVVDTCNYYPRNRDGRIAEIEDGMPESRWVERQLHHAVVKAFNNIYAQHLMDYGKPKDLPGRIALPLAGDIASAKATVASLIEQLGFDPVDAGSIEESWRQQPGTPAYAADLDAKSLRQALAAASPARPPEWRAPAS